MGVLQLLQIPFRLFQLRKELFLCLERSRMYTPAAAAQFHRMPEVQHFMVDQILHSIPGHLGAVKNAADHDGVVRRIIMAKAQAGTVAAPGHLRTRHQTMEEAGIQVFEYLLQVVMRAPGPKNAFAPTHLPDQVHPGDNVLASGKSAEAHSMSVSNFLAVDLGNQDVQDGMNHRLRRALQQIRETHQDASIAQTNGVVEFGEREELNLKFGYRGP